MKKLLYNSKDVEEKANKNKEKRKKNVYKRPIFVDFFGFFEFFCKNILKLLQFCNNIKVWEMYDSIYFLFGIIKNY